MTSINTDTLRDSASEAFDRAQNGAAPMIKEGKRKAGLLLDQSGKVIDSVTTRAGDIAAELGKDIVAYTKKNPLAALLLAVAAGALLISAAKSVRSR